MFWYMDVMHRADQDPWSQRVNSGYSFLKADTQTQALRMFRQRQLKWKKDSKMYIFWMRKPPKGPFENEEEVREAYLKEHPDKEAFRVYCDQGWIEVTVQPN